MAASDSPALGAIVFQFASALEAYESEIGQLLHARFDPELYHRVSHRMDEMRLYAASLPTVSGAWVEVLIRHAELTHGLWRAQQPKADVDLPQLQQQLHDAVRRLSNKCAQLLPSA